MSAEIKICFRGGARSLSIFLVLRQDIDVRIGKNFFSSSTEAFFNHAVITARDWFV